jgi:hypothetical protein
MPPSARTTVPRFPRDDGLVPYLGSVVRVAPIVADFGGVPNTYFGSGGSGRC